jgi:hypothetical protein
MPGIGLEIDGAMQQAPQPGRHAIAGASGARIGITEIGGGAGMPRLSAQVAPPTQPA